MKKIRESNISTIGKKNYCPQEKEMQKQKWLSEEALQIVEKRREVKDKEENESYIHLNAEFQ